MASRSELSYNMRSVTGPDGAIYLTRGMEEYGVAPTTESRIVKLSYVGPCAPVVVPVRAIGARSATAVPIRLYHLGGDSRFHWPEGAGRVRAYGLDGSLAWDARRSGKADAGIVPCGLLQLRCSPQ